MTNILYQIGSVIIFLGRVLQALFSKPFYYKNFILQIIRIGYESLFLVIITAFSVGMIMTLQLGNSLKTGVFANVDYLGHILAESIIKELGPLVTGFMLAGRIGAAVATEIGSMKISEQIYALISLAVNPIQYLVIPRVVCILLIAPAFTILTYFFSLSAGALGSYIFFDQSFNVYLENIQRAILFHDAVLGIFKGIVFGLGMILISCYLGLNAKNGSEGVGRATTTSVVASNVFIILIDYFINYMDIIFFSYMF